MASYTVKSGDTLSGIGAQYGVPYQQITGYKSGNPNLIYAGEVLNVPDKGGAAAPQQSNTPQQQQSYSTPSYTPPDPYDAIKKAIEMQKQANQPTVDSYNAQIPEIQQKYDQTRSQLQASQPSLDEKYKNLLDSIKGNQTQDVNNQTRITSNELGKRGILGSSTLADQEIQNAVTPLNQKYTGLLKDTTLAQSDADQALQNQIANLTPQETSDVRAVNNAIAQLQSGAATSGANLGLNIYNSNVQQQQQQVQNDLAAKQLAAQQAQQQIANSIAQQQLANQTRETNYTTGKPYYQPQADNSVDLSGLGDFLSKYLNNGSNGGAPSTFQPLS